MSKIEAETELKGGKVNYYLVRVEHPQRDDQEPYTAECEDIGAALELTPDEMNVFKEIWRSANARKGNGKPGHKLLYGAEKIAHYAGRILRAAQIKMGVYQRPIKAMSVDDLDAALDAARALGTWNKSTGIQPVADTIRIQVKTHSGQIIEGFAKNFDWRLAAEKSYPTDILFWRHVK